MTSAQNLSCSQLLHGGIFTGSSSNGQYGARLDIAANGFWGGRFEKTYFDVRVFNAHAPFHRQSSIYTCYRRHEQRIREIEHASFIPLVLSTTSGMVNEVTIFYKRLASCIYMPGYEVGLSLQLHHVLVTLPPNILSSSICCIRDARSSIGREISLPSTWPNLNLASSKRLTLMHLSMLAPPSPPTRGRVGNFPCLEWQTCPRGRDIESLKCACAIRIVRVRGVQYSAVP